MFKHSNTCIYCIYMVIVLLLLELFSFPTPNSNVKAVISTAAWSTSSPTSNAAIVSTSTVEATPSSVSTATTDAIDINTCECSLNSSSFEYTSQEILPVVTVKYQGNTLTKDTDYSLSYKNNVNLGVGEVTITGINKYNNSKTLKFSIKEAVKTFPTPGDLVEINNSKYRIKKNGKAYFHKSANKAIISQVIPKSIEVNGYTFKITGISGKAFKNNNNLKLVKIKTPYLTKGSVSSNSFKNTNKKLVIKVPSNKKKLYKKILKNVGNSKLTVKSL